MEQSLSLSPGYLEEDRSKHVLISAILLSIVPTLCLVAYIGSRCMSRRENSWGSWVLILGAYFTLIALVIDVLLSATIGGVGHHTAYWQIQDPVVIVRYSKLALAYKFLWALAVTVSRVAICVFCLRVFTGRKARIATWTVAALLTAQLVAVVVTEFAICRPFAYRWDKNVNGSCGNVQAFVRFSNLSGVLLDLTVVIVLLTVAWYLKASRAEQINVALASLIGILGIAIAVAHTVLLFKNDIASDATYVAATMMPLTMAEACAFFICACLLESCSLLSLAAHNLGSNKRKPPRLPGIRKSAISHPVRDSVVSSIKHSVPTTPTVMVVYEGQVSSWRVVDFDESREESVYGSIHGSVHELV